MVLLLLGLGSCAAQGQATGSPERANAERAPIYAVTEHLLQPPVCSPGSADCDREAANGCEAVLSEDPENCGVCGVQCDLPHANTGCMGGTCRTIQCEPGFADADHDPKNGCETETPPARK